MIIHKGQPSHIYAIINEKILNNIEIPYLQFHYVYELVNENCISSSNNIFKIMSKNFKHPRFDGYLYGIFQESHSNFNNEEDVMFTFIFHPIVKIYNYFYWLQNYYKFYQTLTNFDDFFNKNKKRKGNPTMPISEDIWDFNLLQLILIDENKFSITYENFVDKIINYEDFIFNYKDVSYKTPTEFIYGISDFKNFSFIGKKENLKEFKIFLSDIFKKNIDFEYFDLKFDFNTNYRINELENIMDKQINLYYNN